MSIVQESPHGSSHSSNATIATDAIKLITRIRRHIQDDQCKCCKVALMIDLFKQNNKAGSLGDETTEPADKSVVDSNGKNIRQDL